MDGDGFDADGFDGNGNVWASQDSFAGANAWSQQPSASGPGHGPPARGGFDLNSQAAAAEFPSLRQYGAFLQGDDVELPLAAAGAPDSLLIVHPVPEQEMDGRLRRHPPHGRTSLAAAPRREPVAEEETAVATCDWQEDTQELATPDPAK